MIFEGKLDMRSVVSSVFAFALCMLLAANSRLPLLPSGLCVPHYRRPVLGGIMVRVQTGALPCNCDGVLRRS